MSGVCVCGLCVCVGGGGGEGGRQSTVDCGPAVKGTRGGGGDVCVCGGGGQTTDFLTVNCTVTALTVKAYGEPLYHYVGGELGWGRWRGGGGGGGRSTQRTV